MGLFSKKPDVDETTGQTELMRVKEGSDDYRYFPEPDLPALTISQDWIDSIAKELPEPPAKRRERYVNELGITDYDAMVITQTKEMSDFFDKMIAAGAAAKLAANYLQGDVNAYMNDNQVELQDTKITPEHLATMIKLITDGTISSKMAKKVFKAITKGEEPKKFVEEKGMVQLSDPAKLQPIVDEVVAANPQSVEDFHNGKDRAIGYLVGQIMKQTHGKANPQVINKMLKDSMSK